MVVEGESEATLLSRLNATLITTRDYYYLLFPRKAEVIMETGISDIGQNIEKKEIHKAQRVHMSKKV